MNSERKIKLVSLLYTFVNIGLVLVIAAGIIVIGASVYALLTTHTSQAWGPHFSINSGPIRISIQTQALSNVVFTWLMSFIFISFIAVFVVLLMLRRILASLKCGDAFDPKNPGRLRIIGWSVILWSLVLSVLWFLALPSFQRAIVPNTGIKLGTALDLTSIFIGLVILILAEIFRLGYTLKIDKDLTI